MKNAAIVARLEAEVGIQGAPRSLLDAIAAVLRHEGSGELEAVETASKRLGAVANLITQRRDDAQKEGLAHILQLYGSTLSSVGGASHELFDDDGPVLSAKRGRAFLADIKREIHNLSPDEFEHFGAALVRTFGAKIAEKTASSGDQGIDFVGTVRISDLLDHPEQFFRLTADLQIDFVGQAKHYPTRALGPSAVRELVGSLELARSRNFSSETFRMLEDLAFKSFSPIISILITTGSVTEGAKRVASSSGIVLKSGDQLATYLADLGVGLDQETGHFSEIKFREWMERTGSAITSTEHG